MHSTLWAFFYLLLAPCALFLVVSIIVWLTRKKFPYLYFIVTLTLLCFPIWFIIDHFMSVRKEMALRQGTYTVTYQNKTNLLCGGYNFDNLTLTLYAKGDFIFNYKPCFTDNIAGKWGWDEDMAASFTTFEKINDSLRLVYPIDYIGDPIILKSNDQKYLTFKKVTSHTEKDL